MVYRTYANTDANGNLASGSLTLQHFIIIFGAIQLLISQLPSIHSLRGLNGICTFCTAAFTAVAIGLCIDNGAPPPASCVDRLQQILWPLELLPLSTRRSVQKHG